MEWLINQIDIFINQLLHDLNNTDVGIMIGNTMYNYFAYADDISIFSSTASGLQKLLDICV